MLADQLGVVIGVDTHNDTHTAAAVPPTGAVIDQVTVPANRRRYRRLIDFAQDHEAALWAIEGAGSFGAGLTVSLIEAG